MSEPGSPSAPNSRLTPLAVSDEETGRLLDCSRSHVWRAVKREPGFPQPVRILGRTVFLVAHIHEYLAKKSSS